MAMNQFHKDRIAKKIKCYHNKIKDQHSFLFVFDNDKFGILLRSKGDETALIFSTEKLFFRSRNLKEFRKIPFQDGIKKAIAMGMKKSDGKFPIDAYGFSNIFLEVFMMEFAKVKHKKSTMPPIQCKGG